MHLIPPPSKFCITSVFHFFWVLQLTQEKLKSMLMQNFFFLGGWGGKLGTLGECGSGLYSKWSHYNLGQSCILGEHFSKHRPTTPSPPGSSGVEQWCCVFKRTPHSLATLNLGGKGSSLRKVADLEIVLLCEVTRVNEKKKNDLKWFCPGL